MTMKYRNPMMEAAKDHMLARAGEYGWWGGYHGATRKLPSKRRFYSCRFDEVTISVITSKDRTQVMAFPAYRTGEGNFLCDYSEPIAKWDIDGHHSYFKDGDLEPFVNEVIARTISCDDPKLEVAYLIACIER